MANDRGLSLRASLAHPGLCTDLHTDDPHDCADRVIWPRSSGDRRRGLGAGSSLAPPARSLAGIFLLLALEKTLEISSKAFRFVNGKGTAFTDRTTATFAQATRDPVHLPVDFVRVGPGQVMGSCLLIRRSARGIALS